MQQIFLLPFWGKMYVNFKSILFISVLSKVRVSLKDTVIRLEHHPEGSPKGVALELRIQRLVVSTAQKTFAGLGGSVGCAVQLETRRSQVQAPLRSATFFLGD